MKKKLEEYELNLNDLFDVMTENIKEDIKSFSDLVNLDSSLKRELYLGSIADGVGQEIDGYIRFWNEYDEKYKIPVEKRKPIKIYIDSAGGNLSDTFTIIDAISLSKTPVWTIVTGCAYSGGFFSAIAGHKRFAYAHSSFMMHEGATQTGGDAHKFRNYADFYGKELDKLKSHVIGHTKITEEEYETIKRDDFWLDAKEALEKGVVDKIVEEII